MSPAFLICASIFLLTPLREGRRACRACREPREAHFYSRPCGRGDRKRDPASCLCLYISTHAPAGGATRDQFCTTKILKLISTHAPAGGATRPARLYPRRGPISTHAPAGGATVKACIDYTKEQFLLTPLREGRPERGTSWKPRSSFLLTPLREGRRGLRSMEQA